MTDLPYDFPASLNHSDDDTPTPTWQQVTRSTQRVDPSFVAHVARIVSGTEDEQIARETWENWPGNCQRSIALLVDKIYHEGWLDLVGPIKGWPWDGGFFFWPRTGNRDLTDLLDAKSGRGGTYTKCDFRSGLFARLGCWGHKAWKTGWMENDSPTASLHIGIFEDNSAEVHLDVFNPLCVNGPACSGTVTIPFLGSYNHRLLRLHRRWEHSRYGAVTRTSANFYHLMREHVPLSF